MSDRELEHRIFGIDGEVVVTAENALADPGGLVDWATAHADFVEDRPPGALYPGVRAGAPLPLVRALALEYRSEIAASFGFGDAPLASAQCCLSIVTRQPDALCAEQRVPHIDTSYPGQVAIMVYLCDQRHGGTGFFRQRATGFERIDAAREAAFAAALGSRTDDGNGYIGRDDPDFALIGAVDAAPNRMVAYRSCVLHSGMIPEGGPFGTGPGDGRLTLNIFLNFRI